MRINHIKHLVVGHVTNDMWCGFTFHMWLLNSTDSTALFSILPVPSTEKSSSKCWRFLFFALVLPIIKIYLHLYMKDYNRSLFGLVLSNTIASSHIQLWIKWNVTCSMYKSSIKFQRSLILYYLHVKMTIIRYIQLNQIYYQNKYMLFIFLMWLLENFKLHLWLTVHFCFTALLCPFKNIKHMSMLIISCTNYFTLFFS